MILIGPFDTRLGLDSTVLNSLEPIFDMYYSESYSVILNGFFF